jgi:segregation and condensation protein B
MSADAQLKAHFEAVIYAAEEPVTLAQLAALFAEELAPMESGAEQGMLAMDSTATAEEAPAAESPSDAESDADAPALISAKEKADSAAARAAQRELRNAAKAIVDELIADYSAEGDGARGMEIREVAGGYRMATKPQYHEAVRGFIKSLKPALKLSLPALETLTIVAYKQPITSPEIGEIRGVDVSGVLGGLLSRKLITTAGRKQVLGRPILYKTTKEFLLRFGLKDLSELTSLEEFEKMATEMTEFDDVPASDEEVARERAALDEAEESEPDEAAPIGAALGSEIGPGFSPDNQSAQLDRALAPEESADEDSATTADGLPQAATKGLA